MVGREKQVHVACMFGRGERHVNVVGTRDR